MYKKFFLVLTLLISLLITLSVVSATDINEHTNQTNNQTRNNNINDYNTQKLSSNISSIDSKSLSMNRNKILGIKKSKEVVKAGGKIKIRIDTSNSIKKVHGYITNKKSYKFKKSNYGYWYYYLNTKNYKSGKYKLILKVIDSKNVIYKDLTYFRVDNIPPKVISVKSNVKSIIAGNTFYIKNIADNTSKKVFAKIRGNKYYFLLDDISNKNTKYKTWNLNAKISYKEIGTLEIAIYTYDSVGNYVKKTIYVKSVPYYVEWNNTVLLNNPIKVYYNNPKDNYQKSINELSKYVSVFEGYAGNDYTLGITYNNGIKATRVIIAYMDPFVVYHEMGHVLNWKWTEYQCDYYAYKRTGYWIL